MPFIRPSRFSRFALTLLLCTLLWSGLGRVSVADDLTASSVDPAVFFHVINSIPNPDWAIFANRSIFEVDYQANGLVAPFLMFQGAPFNSFAVGSTGNVGLGTPFPAQKLHIVSGETPSIRLEQDVSLGLPSHTWELRANHLEFLLQDTSAPQFTAPFVVFAGAPHLGLVLNNSGWLGLGTQGPQGNLHIFGDADKDIFSGIGPDLTTGPAFNFGYSGHSFGEGTGFFNVRGANSGVNPSLRFATVNVQRMIITNSGRVGIGTLAPTQLLDVAGSVHATSFIAGSTTLNVPDYVFEPDYKLMPLTTLASYVEKEKHLPDIPSAQEIKEQGVNMSELQMQLLKKVEELTLYTLEQQKLIQHLTAHVATLEQGHTTPPPKRHL